jgi:hypothetical protein
MRKLLFVIVACATSILAYLVIFGFAVSRPLVVDQIGGYMERKMAYAARTGHPKIFIVAGSNARYSHSCAVFEEVFDRPCVNMGISAEVGLDWTFQKTEQQLRSGDVVYLPIEYDLYSRPRVKFLTGMDAAYRFRHDKHSLLQRGPEGMLRAAFMFSLPTFIQSVGEMGLQAHGTQRRNTINTLDKEGDETGNTAASAKSYVAIVRADPQEFPGGEYNLSAEHLFDNPNGSQAAIVAFLEWCRGHGVTAIGGLPTMFNDKPIPPVALTEIKRFYAQHGALFIALPNRSQYPRSDFYDSGYHLQAAYQISHSQSLASLLRPLLPVGAK